jgi:hypothetical protein
MLSHLMETLLLVLIASSRNVESSTGVVAGNNGKNGVDENWQRAKGRKTFRRLPALPKPSEEVFLFRRKHTKSLFVISRRGEQSSSRENLINLIIIRRIRLWHESRFSPFSLVVSPRRMKVMKAESRLLDCQFEFSP